METTRDKLLSIGKGALVAAAGAVLAYLAAAVADMDLGTMGPLAGAALAVAANALRKFAPEIAGTIGLGVLLAVASASACFAQDGAEVDGDEVRRRGDMVQHIDDTIRSGDDAAIEALGPPASDADKWFISVVTMRGCAPCARLKQEWRSNEWLLALARPEEPKQSWAHYGEYSIEDKSQAFRWEKIQIAAYPTIIVQPPRTGRYGDAKTVVFQDVYRGDPRQLASDISTAIRSYVANLDLPPEQSHRQAAEIGQQPPWQPPPRVDPFEQDHERPLFPDAPRVPPLLDAVRPGQSLLSRAAPYLVGAAVPVVLLALLLASRKAEESQSGRQNRVRRRR